MSKPNIDSWILPLVGHQFDLEELQHWLEGMDVQVTPHDEGHALVIPTAVVGADYKSVRNFAEKQLELLNGIGSLLNLKFQPVSLTSSLYGIDSSGAIISTIASIGTAEYRMKGNPVNLTVGGKSQPDPQKLIASHLLRASTISMHAHDALIISGRPALTWSELYLLFELVESDVGSKMLDFGWIQKSEKRLFEQTANSYSALRSQGRHGKDKGSAPSKPMQLSDATNLIKGLVLAWLTHLSTSNVNQNAV